MNLVSKLFYSYQLRQAGLPKYSRKVILSLDNNRFCSDIAKIAKNTVKPASSYYRQGLITRVGDLINKFCICNDDNVKNFVCENIRLASLATDKDKVALEISEAEFLLDSINTAEEKYSVLALNYPDKLQDFAMDNIGKFPKNSKIYTNLKKMYQDYITDAREVFIQHRDKKIPKTINWDEFYNTSKFEALKNYITEYKNTDKIQDYLWEKYFLSERNLTSEIKNKIRKLNEDFDTKLFFDKLYKPSNEILNFIKREFEIWKEAGGNRVKYPLVLDITRYVNYFISKESYGDANYIEQKARFCGPSCVINSLRHEMTHLNDKYSLDETSRVKIPASRKEEMKYAGLSKDDLEYAETDMSEYRAVFSEADMEKISDEFKKEMIEENKLQEFITRLKQNKTKPEHNKLCKNKSYKKFKYLK